MLSRLWQYFTGPVFTAATVTNGNGAVTVIAGQTTKICTIKLSLVAEGKFRDPQEEVRFPRPFFNSVLTKVKVSYGEDRRLRREELELDVFVTVTSAGKYSVTPEFPEDLNNFRSIYKKTVHFDVKPSELNFINLRSIAPLPNHRNTDGDVYRGGMVQVRVAPEDEFGNFITAEGDLSLAIPSCKLSVTLLSVVLNKLDKNFVVEVRCATVGSGHFTLVVSQGDRQVKKDIALKVIRPPVSRIILSEGNEIEKRLHEAGQPITFRFKFIDILGNPIPSEESIQDQDRFRLDPRKTNIYPNWSCDSRYTNENDASSLTVRPSEVDPNVCELEFTPFEVGKRMYYFSVSGKVLVGSFEISVLPREGDDVQVVHNLQREHQRNYEVREEIPYNRNEYLEFYECDQKILCLGVKRRHLVGEDYANINNINRVLEKEYPDFKLSKDLVSWVYGWLVVFDLSSFQKNAALKVFSLLSDLLEGQHHYRNEANKFAKEREIWDGKEAEEIEKLEEGRMEYNYRIEADRYRKLKLTCGNRMHESNEKASDAIFQFYNHSRPQSEIDLHGQRVGNTEKLKELEAKLRRENKTLDEIKRILQQRRQRTDEAIRKLDERWRTFDHKEAKRYGKDWLEIIDGAGHHSERRGEQKIRPKVKEYLKEKKIKYVEANEGALLVTFSEYTGREPCVADFYCTRCTRKWTSTTSWKGLFQRCYRCDSKGIISNCYPFKLRSVPPERKRESTDFTRQDHRRLCQKCMQLGQDCRQLYVTGGKAHE